MTECAFNLTGDHAIQINAITRNQQKKQLLESLPKQAQEALNFNIRKFDGRNSNEAAKWMQDTEEWLLINSLSLISAFDLLLSDEAGILWKNFKSEDTTEESAKSWFEDTFTIKKSIMDMIVELANVQQSETERFATFEIRVHRLVEAVMNSGLKQDSIVKDIISKRTRSNGLKDALALKPDMDIIEVRSAAKVFENREQSVQRDSQAVNTIRRDSYAQALKTGRSNRWNNQYKKESNESSNYKPPHAIRTRIPEPIVSEQKFTSSRERPVYSMKYMAKKLYNKCRGMPDPKEERLRGDNCFCCGESGHYRSQCPLRHKCLICGQEGHHFRSCHLIRGTRHRVEGRILCIQDEIEEQFDPIEDPVMHEIEDQKNHSNFIAYILSVGLNN